MFQTMLGDSSYSEIVKESGLAGFLYLFYLLIASIMLLNLLIAMMGNSYEAVREFAEAEALIYGTGFNNSKVGDQ